MRALYLSIVCLIGLIASCEPALATKRAFLVGINAYIRLQPLQKAEADAELLGEALQRVGFTVSRPLKHDLFELTDAWRRFLQTVEAGDTVVVHFAGHGVQLSGQENMLLPADTDPRLGEQRLRAWAISHREMMDELQSRKPTVSIWLLDACRDNPFGDVLPERAALPLGMAPPVLKQGGGVFVLYAASAGEKALDSLVQGETEPTSVFMRHVLPLVPQPGLTVAELAQVVHDRVKADALTRHVWGGQSVRREQTPAVYNELGRSFCLAGPGPLGCGPTAVAVAAVPKPAVDPPKHTCDELAADPLDLERKASGVYHAKLTAAAVTHCRLALAEHGEVARFIFQLARAVARQAELAERQAGKRTPESAAALAEVTALLKRRSDEGDARATSYLGGLYFDGLLGVRDELKSAALTERAAKLGYPAAMVRLGYFYMEGRAGYQRNVDLGLEWTRRAAAAKHATGISNLGWLTKTGRAGMPAGPAADLAAVDLFRAGVAGGDTNAMCQLGWMHEEGRGGLEKSQAQARIWYEKAADLDDWWGMHEFGWYLLDGTGGLQRSEANDRRAIAMFRQAAKEGHVRSLNALGIVTETGRGGIAKSQSAALDWYRKAAEQHDEWGIWNHARFLLHGRGGLAQNEANAAKALALYRVAEIEGLGRAMNSIGSMHENGQGGLTKDEMQARLQYEKADAAGEAWGTTNLARFYLQAKGGLTADPVKAFALNKKAAEQGNERAMAVLARQFFAGHGVAQNTTLALDWFQRAADKGDSDAAIMLGSIAAQASQWDRAARWYVQGLTKNADTEFVPKSADMTRAIQRELQRLGVYKGAIDGVWGSGSLAALEAMRARE